VEYVLQSHISEHPKSNFATQNLNFSHSIDSYLTLLHANVLPTKRSLSSLRRVQSSALSLIKAVA
jgi:hypothetical protein